MPWASIKCRENVRCDEAYAPIIRSTISIHERLACDASEHTARLVYRSMVMSPSDVSSSTDIIYELMGFLQFRYPKYRQR